MLTTPYVQVNAFKAHPTFLDLLNLRSGDSSLADQTEQLNEILLDASEWVNNYCEQPLYAHVQVDNERINTNRLGQLIHKPWNTPVVSFTSLYSGTTPGSLASVDISNAWIEDGRDIVVTNGPLSLSTNVGPLQFGTFSQLTQFFTQWTYVSGYTNTVLTQTANANDTSIHVQDATGVVPGQVLRILDPGNREAVTVANTFTPVSGPASVPLTSGLQYTHTFVSGIGNGIGVSAVPSDVQLATIMMGVAVCLRRTDTPANTAFPGALVRPSATSSRGGSSTRSNGQAGQPLIDEAVRILEPYKRVR